MKIVDATKTAFLSTWPGGYRENWEVYGRVTGAAEADVVARCLAPFYNRDHVVLEVGCGLGFWTDRYLAPHFSRVVALDLISRPVFVAPNIDYIEVPDRNYECFGVADESIDFTWSFGVFCHMTLEACQKYLDAIFRKSKAGARCSLYFSNTTRRPGTATVANTEAQVPWVDNDLDRTVAMLQKSGFVDIVDLMPSLPDTMVGCRKP